MTNKKDAATQVENDVMQEQQPASAADARKAMIHSARNFSFVRKVLPLTSMFAVITL